jgi:GT2 family glycosyltransferase
MFSPSQPLVSIITVNYKQTEVTLLLLDSLSKCTYPNIEIIVVDNGSNQGLEQVLASSYPQVKCVNSTQNLGFAGGNNLGIAIAKGKHLLFLNNDTEVEPDFLEPMVELLETNPSIGMVSPKIIYFDTDHTIQYAGSTGINPYTGRGEKIGSFEKDQGQHNDTRETSLGHGAAMMLPRSVVEKVGMLPDIFFLYYEEHDWCEAIKRAGYKVFYTGKSIVYHKESISVGKASPLKTYYMARNRLLFLRRNNTGLALFTSVLFFVCLTIPKTTIKYLLKMQGEHLKAFYKGVSWNLFHYNIHGFPALSKA